MMTLFEDFRLALRQICQAIGMSGTAATVVPLVVLGVALNIAALSATEYMRNERHPGHGHTALRCAAQTEMKVMRTVLVSTLKKIGNGQRRWCLAQQWMKHRQTEITRYRVAIDSVWAAPKTGGGCDVEMMDRHHGKATIASAQC
jgi:hypothetical protein